MFWWLFDAEEDPNNKPLIIWLTGGPGCSSELAVFIENGPYKLDHAGENLSLNPYSWHKAGNLLYVDNPIGTGYSVVGHGDKFDTSEDQVAEQFHTFLKGFLKDHEHFEDRDFYITGESYAGHYIPAISQKLVHSNDIKLKFKGVAIGNGWVDPVRQYPAYIDFASTYGMITPDLAGALQP